MKTYSSELVWSNLSNVPIFVYDIENNFHICIWNGVIITKSCALLIIGKVFMDINPSEQQKYVAMQDMVRVYNTYQLELPANYFYTHQIILTDMMAFISKNEHTFFKNLTDQHDVRTALKWLLQSKERVSGEMPV